MINQLQQIYTTSSLTFLQIEILTIYVKEGSNISQDSYKAGEIVLYLVLNIFFRFLTKPAWIADM